MKKMTDQIQDLLPLLQNPLTRDQAFNRLVAISSQPLYWHIRKMVYNHENTNDVLQNSFIKIWKGLDTFRGKSKLFTWMYRITTNETLTFLASARMKNIPTSLEFEENLINSIESDVYFDGDEAELILQKAILTLPEKQRLVFNMKYYEEMKYSEMSEILDTSVGALKASYFHATKKIEYYLNHLENN